jgi:hypothetical protein
MALALLPYEELALADFKNSLLRSTLPFRRPSNTDPEWRSNTLDKTAITTLSSGAGWTNILNLQGIPGFTWRVSGYVTTVIGDAALAGIQWRFVFNGTLAPYIQIPTGVEIGKIGPNVWPVVPSKTFFLVEQKDNLIIQAQSTNIIQQIVLAGLFGWQYYNPNPGEKARFEFITDV